LLLHLLRTCARAPHLQVVKLLGSLVPEEPRLARKLLEPLATIIQNTAAKSLQYAPITTKHQSTQPTNTHPEDLHRY